MNTQESDHIPVLVGQFNANGTGNGTGRVFCPDLKGIDVLTIMDSIWYLGMMIIGGMGSILGAVLGTIFLKSLEEIVNVAGPTLSTVIPGFVSVFPVFNIVIGLSIVAFLIFEPRGLAQRWEIIKAWYRLWPYAR